MLFIDETCSEGSKTQLSWLLMGLLEPNFSVLVKRASVGSVLFPTLSEFVDVRKHSISSRNGPRGHCSASCSAFARGQEGGADRRRPAFESKSEEASQTAEASGQSFDGCSQRERRTATSVNGKVACETLRAEPRQSSRRTPLLIDPSFACLC